MDDGFVLLVVPSIVADELAELLHKLDLVGSVIDGTALGLDGVAVARIVGDDRGVIVVRNDVAPSALSESELLHTVAGRWPEALIGEAAEEEYGLSWPGIAIKDFRTVAVTPPTDLMLSIFAKAAKVELQESRVGDRLLVGIGDDHDLGVDVLVDALVNAKGRSVVLWRAGRHTALHIMKRGKHAEAHMWEPYWSPFGHPQAGDLCDPGVDGDAAAIGALLGLSDPAVVSLRALMRRPDPDLSTLAEVLGLPSEAVDVLEGRAPVAELPGGTVTEPVTWLGELKKVASGSEHDPAIVRWFDAGARELRWWYVLSSVATFVFGGILMMSAGGLHGFGGVFGLVLVLATALDLGVRTWRQARRS